MQGPELLRVGRLEPLPLHEGETVFLGNQCSIGAVRGKRVGRRYSDTTHDAGNLQPLPKVPVPDSIVPFLAEGEEVLLDDGKILLEVSAQTEGRGRSAGSFEAGR